MLTTASALPASASRRVHRHECNRQDRDDRRNRIGDDAIAGMVHNGGAADDRNRQEEEPGAPSVHDRSHKAIVAARTTGVDSADGRWKFAVCSEQGYQRSCRDSPRGASGAQSHARGLKLGSPFAHVRAAEPRFALRIAGHSLRLTACRV